MISQAWALLHDFLQELIPIEYVIGMTSLYIDRKITLLIVFLNIKVIIKLKYNKAILITYHGSVGFLTLALKIKRNARLLCSDWLRKCFAWLRKSREAKNSHRCAAVTRSRTVQARQVDESKKKIRAKNK